MGEAQVVGAEGCWDLPKAELVRAEVPLEDPPSPNPALARFEARMGTKLLGWVNLYGTALIFPRVMFKAVALGDLQVVPEERGRGVGTLLVVRALREARLQAGVVLARLPDRTLLARLCFVPLWTEKGRGFLWARSLVDGVEFSRATKAPVACPDWRD
jgi:GNAT superfamily N-acetyltransferase